MSIHDHETRRLTMAQALVEYLKVQYSERDGERRRLVPALFGIFGHGNVAGLGQALEECGGAGLPYYQPCNEQSMVHTASGYAKANRRLATLACTSSIGPGATNMVSGAATATINRLPVLLLPSDCYATRHQGTVLQELENPSAADVSVNDCFRPVSRFFDRIARPEQLLTALPEAMRVLLDPAETGAVTLSLPQDVQAHAWDFPVRFFEERTWGVDRRPPEPRRIAEAVEMIRAARRPAVIAGGGVHYSDASPQLREFAELTGAAVGETLAGRGAMAAESELCLHSFGISGNPAAYRIIGQSDLVICAGTRLSDFATASQAAFHHPEVKFIGINVAGRDAYKQGALPIVADAREALRALSKACAGAGIKPDAAYVEEIAAARETWRRQKEKEIYTQAPGEAMSQGHLIGILNEEAQPGDTVISAAGNQPGDLHKLWDTSGGRHCHLEFGYSCMGYEIPAGIGVRMAQPQGEVYVFVGDGTYLMSPTEIVTAVQEGLKITVIVSNNHGYQCIRGLQLATTGRDFGNEFRARDPRTRRLSGDYLDIDFAGNGASMGARTWRVETEEELRAALREARAETRPCVIAAEIEKHRFPPPSGMWWDVEVAEVSSNPEARGLRAAYERDRRKQQRFHY